jgi:ABC-type multidrug transport system permease subunit
MESKFHRWWLGSCVAALLLASWAGGFSVAVTAVFVVVYLTGVTHAP